MTTFQPASDSLTEDNQTLALIRRVLCPQAPPNAPLDHLLPALTSSPNVDIQLYAFLAIVCRDFLFSWYSKITNDRVFVDEIIQIIAHTTRSLEQRLRQLDLEILILDEIPALLDNHVRDFRQCAYRHKTALSPHLSPSDAFHNFQPHPALKGSDDDERLYLKLLSSGTLAVLLPTEDLQSNCERALLREIVSNLIFGNIVNNLSEPLLLYEILTKVIVVVQETRKQSLSFPEETTKDTSKPSLDSDEGRKRRKSRKRDSKASNPNPTQSPPPALPPSVKLNPFLIYADKIFAILSILITLITALLATLSTILQNPPPPPRRKKPILKMSILKFLSNFLKMDSRQPWLKGNISLALSPLSSRPSGGLIDNILSYLFQTRIAKNEKILVQSLRLAREALFPNGALGPPRIYPTTEEQARIRETTEKRLLEIIPNYVKLHYFGGTVEDHLKGAREYLDMMGDKKINKHLVYQLIDLVVLRLMPELGEEGPSELMEERIPRRTRMVGAMRETVKEEEEEG